MLPIILPGYAMIVVKISSKGWSVVNTHRPFGFIQVSKLIICVIKGNVKIHILSIVTTIILSYKFKITPVNILLKE